MIRIVFGLLIPVHGLLHLIGAVYGFRLLYTSQYTGQTTIPLPLTALRLTHVLWLVACLLFLAAALLFLLQRDWWWMVGAGAVVLSQTLILLYWPDARWGTIANVLITLLLVVAFGQWRFNRAAQMDVRALLAPPPVAGAAVGEANLKELPPLVQRWLRRSGVVGKEAIYAARLQQRGRMRTTPTGRWMPVKAVQYIRTDQPGFVWIAGVRAAPGVQLAGRDTYKEGRGHMVIRILSVYPVADNKGPKVDQGTLLRYLAELVWVPSGALSSYIHWQAIDDRRIRATMSYGGLSASGVFGFTPEGDPESFKAMRYYDRKGGATLEPWHIQVEPGAYRSFEGVRIPVRSTVSWGLKEGTFTWYTVEIEEAGYNPVNP